MGEYVMQEQRSELISEAILNPSKTATVKANRAYRRYFVKQIFKVAWRLFSFVRNMWSLSPSLCVDVTYTQTH